MEAILFILIGILKGLLIGLLIARSKRQKLVTEIERLKWQQEAEKANNETLCTSLKSQLEEVKADSERRLAQSKSETEAHFEKLLKEKEKSSADALSAQEKRHSEAIASQQARFDETLEKVAAQMRSATDEMLKQRQKEFAESSNTNLGQIVTPLRETIEKMKETMHNSTLKQTEMSSEMKANLENMMRHSEAAKQSADELARVFKHRSKVQGDWGERVLDELLESQGLTRGRHYDIQTTIRDASGNTVKSDSGGIMRPDVVLHLDNNREIIIDSKVSLTAFMDYVNAETEEERQQFLKAHVDSIQKHVKELSTKDYSSYIQPPKVKMDYVIMFVPHTGALWSALNAQPDLWRKAMESNVFIADEQTLFAALRIVSLTWRQIAQAENHEKVYALANEIIERVAMFMEKYNAIGKAIDNAAAAFEDGKKKLVPGGQSILNSCAKLEKLGAKQSKKHPLPQIGDAEPEDN
ncbi:MAG: DNA recombination protein RmuC [Bacteroidaceae bacterium]|nr:DNA recombination protein RmuC [Bacteroidaceae bacterium]